MSRPDQNRHTTLSESAHCQTLHATTIAIGGRAVLIRGPSGSGKSGLALQLLALGASLVADDCTVVTRKDDLIHLTAPSTIKGRVEARGVGILPAPTVASGHLALIIDLAQVEDERLPPWREEEVMGVSVPVLRKTDAAHFPAAIMLYLQHGRLA